MGRWVWMGVSCPCPPVRNDIVTLRHLFLYNQEADGPFCPFSRGRGIRLFSSMIKRINDYFFPFAQKKY